MAHMTLDEANAWLDSTKLSLSTIENPLELQISSQILTRLQAVFDTSTWTNDATTPALIRSIIAMYYVAAIYDRVYSDNTDEPSNYATKLRAMADANIAGLLSGAVILPEDPTANSDGTAPVFFPNDASSFNEASDEFPSDGGPAFTMGSIF